MQELFFHPSQNTMGYPSTSYIYILKAIGVFTSIRINYYLIRNIILLSLHVLLYLSSGPNVLYVISRKKVIAVYRKQTGQSYYLT
ncbi:hypothetical protein L9F63_001440, partial [Diploptera punctata]